MARGRPKSVSDDRLLVELLLHPDRAVFTSEIADAVEVSNQTVRERMNSLADDGYVEISDVSGGKLYRLSETGMTYLRELLRSQFQ
jgi:Mn-dependent DtxR family transcriptional regulator